ncbi:MAG: hypothetical protein JXA21_10460 [Anaerolineae bacterium]|nr:hypothetical protein [Anaerolineae bacterium]
MDVRLVFRNTSNRDDAAYVITATTRADGVITVAGAWGRWETFRQGGKLQRKVYYTGAAEIRARNEVRAMQRKRYERGYVYQPDLSTAEQPTAPQWTASPPLAPVKPTPVTPPPPENPPAPYAEIQTRAGALEF